MDTKKSGPVATRTAPNTNDLTDSVPRHPRGGDPRRRHRLRQRFGRRRVSRELALVLGIVAPTVDVTDIDFNHVTGLDLGYVERQPAAGVAG